MSELHRHTSAQLEKMLEIPRPSLSSVAQRLPLSPHGRKGATRRYTTQDAVLVHMAVEFARSGLLIAVVVDMIAAIKERLLDVLHEKVPFFVVARLRYDDETGRYAVTVSSDVSQIAAVLLPNSGPELTGGAAVFNISALADQFIEKRRAFEAQETADEDD